MSNENKIKEARFDLEFLTRNIKDQMQEAMICLQFLIENSERYQTEDANKANGALREYTENFDDVREFLKSVDEVYRRQTLKEFVLQDTMKMGNDI